jgi:hypothetical protein
LPGWADIVLEMHWYGRGGEDDRRRRLYGWSRYEETPRQLVIELTADGTDYLCHGAATDEEYARGWPAVCAVLAAALTKRTAKEILADWPEAAPRPSETTLWRWLDRAVAQGLVRRDGEGRRSDPHRYWLAGQEKRWLEKNPGYLFELIHEADAKRLGLPGAGPFGAGPGGKGRK